MKKRTGLIVLAVCLTCLIGISASRTLFAQKGAKEAKPKYIGNTTGCICHKTLDTSFDVLLKTKHSKAYETLKSEASKKLSKDPLKDPKCLKCHTTGFNEGGGYSLTADEKTKKEMEAVKCEACHGPAEKYKIKHPAIKDPAKKAEGRKKGEMPIKPDEKVCQKCHNKESPTYQPLKMDEALKIIKHGKKGKK